MNTNLVNMSFDEAKLVNKKGRKFKTKVAIPRGVILDSEHLRKISGSGLPLNGLDPNFN